MAETIIQFIQNIAKKAGIQEGDKSLQHITGLLTDVSAVEIPDDLLEGINTKLYNEEAATQRIMPKIKAEVYNGMDSFLKDKAKEIGVADEDIRELFSEKKTTKDRFHAIIERIKSSKETSKSKDNDQYVQEINSLKTTIAEMRKSSQDEIQNVLQSKEKEFISLSVNNLLSQYRYLDILGNDAVEIANMKFNKKLSEDGLQLQRENGVLHLTTKDGTKYLDKNNNLVNIREYIDGAVATLLKKTDSKEGNNNKFTPAPEGFGKKDSSFLQSLDSQIASFDQ